MHTIRWTMLMPAVLTTVCWSMGSGDPDFSGRWVLNRQQSEIRALPSFPAATLTVEHQGTSLRVTEPGGARPVVFAYTTDRKETRTKLGDTVYSSVGKWEGAALLVNTIVNAPSGGYTQMDRWTLSRDGATLTIRRDIVRLGGSIRSTIVYERDGPSRFASRPQDPPAAQEPRPQVTARPEEKPAEVASAPQPQPKVTYVVETGTNIPLTPLNSVSTKHSLEGDRVYLTTIFPIISNGRVVIPPGSYVIGTVTQVKRPGRVRGRGELFLRFDTLTLPNGVTRDFRSRIGAMDGDSSGELDRAEGGVKSETNKAGDARTIGEAAGAGTSVGVIAGSAAGHPGMGAGIGAAAGAMAGVMGVLLSRGPDAVIPKGSTLEMKLDRTLIFEETEVRFDSGQHIQILPAAPQPASNERRSLPLPGRW